MLLPTEEETAMSPNPFLATITDVIKSGIEVPAARKVKPITCEEQSIVRYHSDNMKGPALTWSAVETNWEISSRCLAIRYTTGFKPFYFHCKSQLSGGPLHHLYHILRIKWWFVHLRRNPDRVARDRGPPDHQVGVEGNPDDRPKESYREELAGWKGQRSFKCSQLTLKICARTLCGVYLIKWWLLGCSKISGQTWAKYTSRCKKGETLWSFKQGL